MMVLQMLPGEVQFGIQFLLPVSSDCGWLAGSGLGEDPAPAQRPFIEDNQGKAFLLWLQGRPHMQNDVTAVPIELHRIGLLLVNSPSRPGRV